MNLEEIWRRLDLNGPGRTVLVVEDYLPLLNHLTRLLSQMGHSVFSLVGVSDIKGHIATGIGTLSEEIVSVDLRLVDAAFMDHYFLSKSFNGESLTREITSRGAAKVFGHVIGCWCK